MARAFEVGVWLTPQHTTARRVRQAARAAESLGVDAIWLWDHFFPLTGDPNGGHLEGWTLLAALAVETRRPRIGMLVANYAYRNPDLLADMARTVDNLSDGRLTLGLGAGWFERDYRAYGYPFRDGPTRAREFESAVPRIRSRLATLNPPPTGKLPLLIGGDGRKVMLRLVAQYADEWNTMAWRFVESSACLDQWCARVGRDPKSIRRSCFITEPEHLELLDDVRAAGVDQVIVQVNEPYSMRLVHKVLRIAEPSWQVVH